MAPTPPNRRVVYVTYDGLADPLGQSQVLPYVKGLAARGHRFELVSFEKPGVRLVFRERLADNVRWTSLRYHRRPTLPATLLDMAQGLAGVALQSILSRADLVHARSYVAAALVLPWVISARVPLLFDTRGFWADEKVEGGAWAAGGRLYAGTKSVERLLLRRADHVSVLTHAALRHLRREYPHRGEIRGSIGVIPTCVDLQLFRPEVAANPEVKRELGQATVLVYVGSLGTFYLVREMAEFYLAWRKQFPSTRFLVVSRQQPDAVRAVLRQAGADQELVHRAAAREEIPGLLRCAHAGIGLDGRRFAGTATAPTKLGEMLAMGLPVVANPVGDVRDVLSGTRAGVLLEDLTPRGFAAAAAGVARLQAATETTAIARELAQRWFSLEKAIDAYGRVYGQLPRRHGDRNPLSDVPWV